MRVREYYVFIDFTGDLCSVGVVLICAQYVVISCTRRKYTLGGSVTVWKNICLDWLPISLVL